MANKTTIDWIALVLVVIGAVNWGLVGLFNLDLVAKLFGAGMIAKIVYILVGISGLYTIYYMTKK